MVESLTEDVVLGEGGVAGPRSVLSRCSGFLLEGFVQLFPNLV